MQPRISEIRHLKFTCANFSELKPKVQSSPALVFFFLTNKHWSCQDTRGAVNGQLYEPRKNKNKKKPQPTANTPWTIFLNHPHPNHDPEPTGIIQYFLNLFVSQPILSLEPPKKPHLPSPYPKETRNPPWNVMPPGPGKPRRHPANFPSQASPGAPVYRGS